MKKLVSVLFAGGLICSAGSVSAQSTMSVTRARSIALAHVDHNQGVLSSKLKTKDGVEFYEFDIETPGPGHQEVRVDAHTGYVISSNHEDDLIGKAGQKVQNAADKAALAADRVFNKNEYDKAHPRIPEARARVIAQRAVPGAPVKDIDLETKHGILVWEIDLDTAGPGHEEVLVDANTGDILRRKHSEDIVSRVIGK